MPFFAGKSRHLTPLPFRAVAEAENGRPFHCAKRTAQRSGRVLAPLPRRAAKGMLCSAERAAMKSGRPYLVQAVVHASEILRAFESRGEVLRLRDVVSRTGYGKGLCFRLLHTLHHCGFVEKVDESRYRLTADIHRRKRYRIGYAAQGQDTSFPREVHAGLVRAAEREEIELIAIDNRYQPKVAVRNAEHLIREKVDLVIEFQTDEAVAPAIASRYLQAGIPFIAIDIPHPGGTYFGANNYQAGLLAGTYLGRWARTRWNAAVDEVVLLELGRAGSLVHARMSGVLAGLKETLRDQMERCRVVTIDGDGQFKTSLERVRKHLRESHARHVLVGAANDPSALGATRAFQEAGRANACAIVGQNAEPDARAELRQPRTPLVASVGFFPERYGDSLIRLAIDILTHRPTPPAVFMRHQLITAENVDHFYPNDALLEAATRSVGF
jgi:ribose transport system substrate-binding protein